MCGTSCGCILVYQRLLETRGGVQRGAVLEDRSLSGYWFQSLGWPGRMCMLQRIAQWFEGLDFPTRSCGVAISKVLANLRQAQRVSKYIVVFRLCWVPSGSFEIWSHQRPARRPSGAKLLTAPPWHRNGHRLRASGRQPNGSGDQRGGRFSARANYSGLGLSA